MPIFKPFNLGDRVKDPITGLSGIVVCVTTWLNGCVRVGLQPEKLQSGKPPDIVYFDETQLRLVRQRVHEPLMLQVAEAPAPSGRRSNGGPSRETKGFARQ